jgi:hypothetical protein
MATSRIGALIREAKGYHADIFEDDDCTTQEYLIVAYVLEALGIVSGIDGWAGEMALTKCSYPDDSDCGCDECTCDDGEAEEIA